jgi:hypothetical protein
MIRRQTRSAEILSSGYSARIEAVEALRAAGLGAADAVARVNSAAGELNLSVAEYGEASIATSYAALASLMEIVSLLLQWRACVLDAAPDAQRFLTAAKERASLWLEKFKPDACPEGLAAAASEVSEIQAISEVGSLAVRLAAVPLPVGLYSVPVRERASRAEDEPDKASKPLQIAFLKFTIDAMPVAETHYVSPGEMHDLDVEVRVSRWPQGASSLVLEPVSIEPSGTYQLPTFSIEAPVGEGPFRLNQQGRALLVVPQHFGARPYEFKYRARFLPGSSEQPY